MEIEEQMPADKQENSSPLYQKLQDQIQFYFSDANLLTDASLLKKIRAAHRSWVPLTYLMQCRKIRGIMKDLNISLRGRRRKIAKVIKKSEALKMNDWKVKRKKPFQAKREKQKMVYIEAKFPQGIQKIIEQVVGFCANQNIKISKKSMNSWAVIVSQSKQQSKQLERYLRIKGESMEVSMILNGTEWQERESNYEVLRRKLQKHKKIHKTCLKQ